MLYFKEKLPEDWQIEPIVNLIENYQQGFASGARDDDGIIQLRMNNITTGGRVILDSFLKVPIPENIDRYLLKKDDVIFNNTNSVKLIGKTAIFNDECEYCTFSNHLTRLRANKLKVAPHWLLYHFNQAWRKYYFRRICNAHVNQAGIKREDIENFKIPLPKLSEQIKIISIINNIQNLIGKINIIIDQLQLMKKGLMQRLFKEGIGHTEFKETRVGRIPKEWEISSLKKLVDLETGKRAKGGALNKGNVASIGGEHIDNFGNVIWDTMKFIPDDFYEEMNNGKVELNDILVVKDGATTGKTGFVKKLKYNKVAINEHVFIVRSKDRELLLNSFLYYILYSRIGQSQMIRKMHGIIGGITRKDINSVIIPVPEINEQKIISEIFLNIDKKIDKEKETEKKLKKIKKGLMQDLLTGKKRVKIN